MDAARGLGAASLYSASGTHASTPRTVAHGSVSHRAAATQFGGASTRKFRALSLDTPTATRPPSLQSHRNSFYKVPSEEYVRLDAQIEVPEAHLEDAIRDYYPAEVWKLLHDVVPGLTL